MRDHWIFLYQIVRHDRTMEQIVFPVPNICEYLTDESKVRVFTTTERDDQGSKVNDFFQQFDNLYNEMRWQKKIRSKFLHSESRAWKILMVAAEAGCRTVNHDQFWLLLVQNKLKGLQRRLFFFCFCPCTYASRSVCAENKALFWFSRHISLWGSISFYLACLVNIAVAVFYPFGDDGDEGENFSYK